MEGGASPFAALSFPDSRKVPLTEFSSRQMLNTAFLNRASLTTRLLHSISKNFNLLIHAQNFASWSSTANSSRPD